MYIYNAYGQNNNKDTDYRFSIIGCFLKGGKMSNEIEDKSTAKQDEQQVKQKQYQMRVERVTPKAPIMRNICWAFAVGGLICTIGQLITDYFIMLGLSIKDASACATVVLIFLGAFFTGIGVYDQLGKRAGAGSIIPITGFANSIVAPAMEFKREGYVFGIGAKMFVIAGPVLVYGIITSFIVGLIYWIRH